MADNPGLSKLLMRHVSVCMFDADGIQEACLVTLFSTREGGGGSFVRSGPRSSSAQVRSGQVSSRALTEMNVSKAVRN
jgi:hypothetical protein